MVTSLVSGDNEESHLALRDRLESLVGEKHLCSATRIPALACERAELARAPFPQPALIAANHAFSFRASARRSAFTSATAWAISLWGL